MFMVTLRGVKDYDPYFQCKPDVAGIMVISICMLLYGISGDIFDKYLRMSESTYLDSMYQFCRVVNMVFGKLYLRAPTIDDIRWLSINDATWFPGMIGSIDFMHWQWKNYSFG
jgi:hypothetical protein